MKILYIVNSLSVGGAETIAANYAVELKRRGHDVSMIQIKNEDTFLKDMVVAAGVPLYTTESATLCADCGQAKPTNDVATSMGVNLSSDSYSNCNCTSSGNINSISHSDGHKHIKLPGKLVKLLSILKFCYYIKKINPDVIHVHTGLEKFRFVRWFPANRIFYTIHSEWSKCKEKGSNHKKMLFELIDRGMNVIVLSSKAECDVREEFPSAKITVLPNGMDLDKIRSTAYDRDFLYNEFGISRDAFVMGHVGRFHPIKNHEKLIHVFEEVSRQLTHGFPDGHILKSASSNFEDVSRHILNENRDEYDVVGHALDSSDCKKDHCDTSDQKAKCTSYSSNQTDCKYDCSCIDASETKQSIKQVPTGPAPVLLLIGSGTTEEQARIRALVDSSPLRNNVVFAGLRQDATAIMGALDAIVMTSFSEAFPLVPIEAQILGTRCILSDVIPEEIFCNSNCIPMSLSASDTEWARAVIGEGTVDNSHSLDQFSLSTVIDKHIYIYNGGYTKNDYKKYY